MSAASCVDCGGHDVDARDPSRTYVGRDGRCWPCRDGRKQAAREARIEARQHAEQERNAR